MTQTYNEIIQTKASSMLSSTNSLSGFQEQLTHLLNFVRVLKIILTIFCFNQLLRYNHFVKKTVFMGVFILIAEISRRNQRCAKTAAFLTQVIMCQVILIGLVITFINLYPNKHKNEKKSGQKLKLCQNCKSKYLFLTVIAILVGTSVVGLFISIKQEYYLQMFQPQLFQMLGIIAFGFVIVTIGDHLYVMLSKGRAVNDTTRRKIFHFVPVLLLPALARINYKLFTLMAFGSFYLFWILQLTRYFGKISRVQCKFALKIKKIDSQEQDCIAVNKKSRSNFLLLINNVVQFVDNGNKSLANTRLIVWMEQLNSKRQTYFWFTHLSLILGLMLSYIYYVQINGSAINDEIQVKQNISVILVIADAMAAIIGRKYGTQKSRIAFTNKKTLEGYMAYVFTAITLQLLLYLFTNFNKSIGVNSSFIIFVLMGSSLCGIGELFSQDLDNIVCVIIYIIADNIWISSKAT